jgi:hypothetical protein
MIALPFHGRLDDVKQLTVAPLAYRDRAHAGEHSLRECDPRSKPSHKECLLKSSAQRDMLPPRAFCF